MQKNRQSGFTVVELLVVVIVIGILAAITIVSYSGIRQRANLATLQSDLKNASTQLEVYKTTNNDSYPIDQATANLKASPSTSITYNRYSATSYCVEAINSSATYHISSTDKTITAGVCIDPDWITIGTQTWARYNLNVGTRITGTTEQANNATIEKYCYNDLESNCTTYGGLYQWDEAMQYVTTPGDQDICSAGSHIPTDAEWWILIEHLGVETAGTQLEISGSSGLNIPLAGDRNTSGVYSGLSSNAVMWTSSESSTNTRAWYHHLQSGDPTLNWNSIPKNNGFSIRCLKN